MVSPVTGPLSKTTVVMWINPTFGWSVERGRKVQTWYRQAKPYNQPLPYLMRLDYIDEQAGYGNTGTDRAFKWDPSLNQRALYAQAYGLFVKRVNAAKASLGATLGEYKSSSSMVANRATQLYNGFRAAKRGDVSGLKRAWGKHAGIRSRARAAGGHVLEYSFGWAPLVSDLNSALEVFHNRLPPFRVQATARASQAGSIIIDQGSTSSHHRGLYKAGYALRGEVVVTNPNTLLAQQLGLVNLASVAWELTPNSYIVDYFFNVGQFIDSFTDFVGIELERSSHTFFDKQTASMFEYNNPGYFDPWPGFTHHSFSAHRVTVNRQVGIPGPSLVLKLPWTVSWQRGSTSIARLLQLLKGK